MKMRSRDVRTNERVIPDNDLDDTPRATDRRRDANNLYATFPSGLLVLCYAKRLEKSSRLGQVDDTLEQD